MNLRHVCVVYVYISLMHRGDEGADRMESHLKLGLERRNLLVSIGQLIQELGAVGSYVGRNLRTQPLLSNQNRTGGIQVITRASY